MTNQALESVLRAAPHEGKLLYLQVLYTAEQRMIAREPPEMLVVAHVKPQKPMLAHLSALSHCYPFLSQNRVVGVSA